jgi:hypothetical protein
MATFPTEIEKAGSRVGNDMAFIAAAPLAARSMQDNNSDADPLISTLPADDIATLPSPEDNDPRMAAFPADATERLSSDFEASPTTATFAIAETLKTPSEIEADPLIGVCSPADDKDKLPK